MRPVAAALCAAAALPSRTAVCNVIAGTLPWIVPVGWLHCDYHAAVDVPGFQVTEDPVDVLELRCIDVRMNLPLGRKRDRLGKVLTCPHDRAANGDALQHNIEDWRCEFAWRKANEAYGPTRLAKRSACANAGGDTAVTSTPCAPPPVACNTCATNILDTEMCNLHIGPARMV